MPFRAGLLASADVAPEFLGGWQQAGSAGGEEGLVGVAGLDGCGEGVVDLEDGFFSAVVAVFGFVFALHDGESVHDVADGMAESRSR